TARIHGSTLSSCGNPSLPPKSGIPTLHPDSVRLHALFRPPHMSAASYALLILFSVLIFSAIVPPFFCSPPSRRSLESARSFMLHFMAQKPTSLFYYSTNHVGRQEKLDNGIHLAGSIRTQKEAV